MRDHLIIKELVQGLLSAETSMYYSVLICVRSLYFCLRTTYNRVLCYSSKVQRGHIASACSISEKPIGTATEVMTGLIIHFEPITSLIYLIAYHCPTLTLVGEGVIPTLPTLFLSFSTFSTFSTVFFFTFQLNFIWP